MDDAFDLGWSQRFTGRHPAIEAELASLMDVYGTSLVNQTAQLQMLLTQACPDATRQIAALVAAIGAGVAARLRAASDDAALPGLLRNAVQDLRRHGVDDADWAWWAVRTWAHAFALPTSERERQAPPAAAASGRPAFAPWQTEPAKPARVASVSPPPGAADAPAAKREPPRFEPIVPGGAAVASDSSAPAVKQRALPPPGAAPGRRSWGTADEARPRRTRRPALIAASIAVPLLAVLAYVAWRTTTTRAPSPQVVEQQIPSASTARVEPPVVADVPRPSVAVPAPIATPAPATAPVAMPEAPAVAATPAVKAAVPAAVITRIDVPRIVDGEPFDLVVRLAGDTRDVVAVERRFSATSGAWPKSGVITISSKVRNAVTIPFRALPAPAQATIDFVAIARDGSRSEPKSVTLVVAAGDAPALAGGPDGCTPSTCGVVVESREVEGSASVYRIVVRSDARESSSFSAPYRLQAGTRVRMAGGRVVPIGATP